MHSFLESALLLLIFLDSSPCKKRPICDHNLFPEANVEPHICSADLLKSADSMEKRKRRSELLASALQKIVQTAASAVETGLFDLVKRPLPAGIPAESA